MNFTKIVRLIAILICFCSLLAAQAPPLAVVDEALPSLEAGVEFHVLLHATRRRSALCLERGQWRSSRRNHAQPGRPAGRTPRQARGFRAHLKSRRLRPSRAHHQQRVPGRGCRFSVARMASTSKGARQPDRRRRPGLQWFQRHLRSDHHHRGRRRKWAGDGNRLSAFPAKRRARPTFKFPLAIRCPVAPM